MKQYHSIFILLIFSLFASLTLTQQNAMSQTKFKKYSGNPVLTAGPAGSWDADNVDCGSVLYQNSMYHMWYTGQNGSESSIGYAFSSDGITWTKYSGNPVLLHGASEDFDALIGLPSVIYDAGTFHLWYTAFNNSTITMFGYAYSTDGIQWTKHESPVFQQGSTGNWDDYDISVGPVIKEDSVLKMFYGGRTSAGSWKTGLAVSTDSIHWSRQNSGNPVLAGGAPGAWDQISQRATSALTYGSVYQIWYSNFRPSPYNIGYATSTDGGINWSTYPGNPILTPTTGEWDAGYLIFPIVLRDPNGRYTMYYTGGNSNWSAENIGLAIDTAITQLTGTYTVGMGGNFSTLDSAFARLNKDGVLGPVTLLLTDSLYDATSHESGSFRLTGPIAGAGPASRITIRPADHVALTIQGNGSAALHFEQVSYLTLDGIQLQGDTRLKVRALYNGTFLYNDAIDFWGNCDHNIIQNLSVCSDDITRQGIAVALIGYDNNSGSPDSCLLSGLSITSGAYGIYLYGPASMKLKGNVIRNNHIGSPIDSLIALGIYNDFSSEGTVIEYNHIENLRLPGINGPSSVLIGIALNGSRNSIIRNNIVHNIRKYDANYVTGIRATGLSNERGLNNWIYNNKVWDITNSSEQCTELAGILAKYQDSLKVDYNTVILPESGDTPPSGGSQALWFQSTALYPTVRNNILVNARTDSPHVSVAIKFDTPVHLSEHNDLVVGTSGRANIASLNSALYKTLADWQGTLNDVHSVSICPCFCTMHMHIDTTTAVMNALEGKGTPIAGIFTDFEGRERSSTSPDIGADEFDKTTGVSSDRTGIPETFSLSQNYPNPFNPTTTIRYALPSSANVKLNVYDLLGREIATLVNEEQSAGWKEVEWNARQTNGGQASAFSSGIYFYKLEVGSFAEVKKLILLK